MMVIVDPAGGPGARRCTAGCGRRCCDWPGRTKHGDTAGSTDGLRGVDVGQGLWSRVVQARAPLREAVAAVTQADVAIVTAPAGGSAAHRLRPARVRVLRAADRVDSGWIQVNQGGGQVVGESYGGAKESGLGREFSVQGTLEAFMPITQANVRLSSPAGTGDRVGPAPGTGPGLRR